jgi:methylase of polypeptide subunit release factors
METIYPDPQPTRGVAGHLMVQATSSGFDSADRALLTLGRELKDGGYRFTAVTPATHARVVLRATIERPSLRDIFGWSRVFSPGDIPEKTLTRMTDAGILDITGSAFRSNVRFSTLGDQLFVHSAFPTEQADAVFFGPDTYRFARLIHQSMPSMKRRIGHGKLKILDIGAGTGAGGLQAATLAARSMPIAITLSDINQCALRLCRINAALNGFENVQIVESDLYASIDGTFDLILANPPYLVDPLARMYRHGGGELGFELSLRIAEQGVTRLAPGGRLLLYTASAIVDGVDAFHEALSSRLTERGVEFAYEEIDPDVFGEELDHPPYDRADRIAVVSVTIDGLGAFHA